MSTFLWTFVLKLCFDDGGVHNLLVGSEPIHCSYYLSLCIYRLQTLLSYPWWGGTSILHIVSYIVSYLWWGDTFMFILLFLFLLLSYSRAMFSCMFLIVWGPRVCRHGDYKLIGHAEISKFRT